MGSETPIDARTAQRESAGVATVASGCAEVYGSGSRGGPAGYAPLTQLSEASFFMYLLHRPLYLWMQIVWFPSTEKEQVPYLLFVCLPIIGIVAWLCQRAYTGFLQRRVVRVAAPNE